MASAGISIMKPLHLAFMAPYNGKARSAQREVRRLLSNKIGE